jgi:phosphoglycolate phosphatase
MELVIFDFEGTLVDFQWQLEAAMETLYPRLEYYLAAAGINALEIAGLDYCRLYNFLGESIADASLRRETISLIDEVFDTFDADAATRWQLHPEVPGLLASLRQAGIRLALASNVGRRALELMFEKFALGEYFATTVTRNDVSRLKPNPEGIFQIRKFFAAEIPPSAPVLLVGDSVTDIETARNAALAVAILTNGEDRTARLEAHHPDYLIENLNELNDLLGLPA